MPTSAANPASSQLFAELQPGDRIEIDHGVKIGSERRRGPPRPPAQ